MNQSIADPDRAEKTTGTFQVLIRNRNTEVRTCRWAVRILEHLGRTRKMAEAFLMILTAGPDARQRLRAARTLAELGQTRRAARICQTLVRNRNLEGWDRFEAAWALERMGLIREAGETFLFLARDQNAEAWVRLEAAEALERLGRAEEAIQVYQTLARNKELGARTRLQAAGGLARLGQAREAIGILLAMARDESQGAWARLEAAKTLASLGQVEMAAEILLTLLDIEWPEDEAREAARALVRLGGARAGEAIRIAVRNGDQRMALRLAGAFREAPEGLRDILPDDVLKLIALFPIAGKEIVQAASQLDPSPDWLAIATAMVVAI